MSTPVTTIANTQTKLDVIKKRKTQQKREQSKGFQSIF